jgi:hypothetical protein
VGHWQFKEDMFAALNIRWEDTVKMPLCLHTSKKTNYRGGEGRDPIFVFENLMKVLDSFPEKKIMYLFMESCIPLIYSHTYPPSGLYEALMNTRCKALKYLQEFLCI